MNAHDTDQVLSAAVYAAVARAYDNERSIEDAADEILDAIEADRQRNDNWRHAVMCAISHNDYETDAPRRVQQALRLLSDAFHGLPFRESIVDDLIADRQRRGEPVACFKCGHAKHGGECVNVAPQSAEPRLDAPAQVGPVRFGIGVKWSNVIRAAQRHHEYMRQPDQEQARMKKFGEAIKAIQPAEPVDKSANLQSTVVDKSPEMQSQPAKPAKVPSNNERASQGLPPYSPRHLTEEEWNRLTENGRKAWGKKPDEP